LRSVIGSQTDPPQLLRVCCVKASLDADCLPQPEPKANSPLIGYTAVIHWTNGARLTDLFRLPRTSIKRRDTAPLQDSGSLLVLFGPNLIPKKIYAQAAQRCTRQDEKHKPRNIGHVEIPHPSVF
jgi:hypothetical protein